MIKETNMEHFRGEIGRIIEELPALNVKIAVVNGEPKPCYKVGACKDCEFKPEPGCFLAFTDWLMSEYKPEPVLTAREKHFVEFAQEGWLARDDDGDLWWYRLKPEKKKENWSVGSVAYSFKGILDFEQHFRFITWEDEEPWAVEELRKLKVQE